MRHVDFTTPSFKLAVFAKLPRRAAAKAAGLAATGGDPDGPTAKVVADPRKFGYGKLYKLVLEKSKPAIARAMRLVACEECYPLLVFCIHGCAPACHLRSAACDHTNCLVTALACLDACLCCERCLLRLQVYSC